MKRNAPMKPGKPLTRTKPMARSGKRMKSRAPKMTPTRKAARGQDCTLRIPGVCNFDPATTVLCHSPYLESGRGMGLKAPDSEACFGCNRCHDVLDRRVPLPPGITAAMVEGAFINGVALTHEVLRKQGIEP